MLKEITNDTIAMLARRVAPVFIAKPNTIEDAMMPKQDTDSSLRLPNRYL